MLVIASSQELQLSTAHHLAKGLTGQLSSSDWATHTDNHSNWKSSSSSSLSSSLVCRMSKSNMTYRVWVVQSQIDIWYSSSYCSETLFQEVRVDYRQLHDTHSNIYIWPLSVYKRDLVYLTGGWWWLFKFSSSLRYHHGWTDFHSLSESF